MKWNDERVDDRPVTSTPQQFSIAEDELLELENLGRNRLAYGATSACLDGVLAPGEEESFSTSQYVKATGGRQVATVRARTGKPSLPRSVESKAEGGAEVSILQDRFSLPAEGTDASSAIAAASAIVAAEGKKLKFPGGRTYDAGAGISITHDNAHWVLDDDAVIDGADVADNSPVINVYGATTGSAVAITGPVDPLPEDTYAITLTSAYTGLAAGDWVQIVSNETVATYQSETVCKREIRQVASVDTVNVVLREPLQERYIISGKTITLQKITMVDKFRLTGGKILGEGGSSAQYGVQLKYAKNCEVKNAHIADGRRQGLRVIDCLDTLIAHNTVTGSNEDSYGYGITVLGERVRVEANTVRDCRHGIDASGGVGYARSRGVVIHGNTVSDCRSAGISTHGGPVNTVISDNVVEGCGGGIINRSMHTTITGNKIRGTKSTTTSNQSYVFGIYLQRELGAIGTIVTGNTIDLGGYETTNADAIAISQLVGDVDNVIIADNIIRNFCRYGLYCNNTGNVRDLRISGNIFDCAKQAASTLWHGIFIDADEDTFTKRAISVTNNHIDAPQGSGIRIYGGISASYRATGVKVSGNVISNNASGATAGVQMATGHWGAGCSITDNHTPGHPNATAAPTTNCTVTYTAANFSIQPVVYGNTYGTRAGSMVIGADIDILPVGFGLNIAEGTNGRMGAATLVAGTATVSTTEVTANSRIQISTQALGTVTAPKAIAVTARTAATSFVITSEDNTDTSTVAWTILEPATSA